MDPRTCFGIPDLLQLHVPPFEIAQYEINYTKLYKLILACFSLTAKLEASYFNFKLKKIQHKVL